MFLYGVYTNTNVGSNKEFDTVIYPKKMGVDYYVDGIV